MNIDRESWERRWKVAPELQPGTIVTSEQSAAPNEWGLIVGGECMYPGMLCPAFAALICWRAVEWLCERSCSIEGAPFSRTLYRVLGEHDVSGMRPVLANGREAIDALGAAIDAVEAGKEKL